jgi:hypothetical protein
MIKYSIYYLHFIKLLKFISYAYWYTILAYYIIQIKLNKLLKHFEFCDFDLYIFFILNISYKMEKQRHISQLMIGTVQDQLDVLGTLLHDVYLPL